jgi:hypothetical protein
MSQQLAHRAISLRQQPRRFWSKADLTEIYEYAR